MQIRGGGIPLIIIMEDKEEYRTGEDVWKELCKTHAKMGDLIFELDRMMKK